MEYFLILFCALVILAVLGILVVRYCNFDLIHVLFCELEQRFFFSGPRDYICNN